MTKGITGMMFLVVALLGFAGMNVNAAERYGLVFDVQGNVEVQGADGKVTKLKKTEHVLFPVNEGDRVKVIQGKVVIVSLKENKGYELASNSEGIVKNRKLVAVKGSVKEIQGLNPPGKGVSGSIGGIVLRSIRPCIKTVSPVNTNIFDVTPELVWNNTCRGDKKVTVKIMSGEQMIFHAESAENALKIPPGVLQYGKEYRWIIDGGKNRNISGGGFTIVSEDEAKEIAQRIAFYRERGDDLSYRLSYIFYLLDRNLNETAKAEIQKLKRDYPENTYIRETIKTD
ncbi:MAG: hypothetical protein A4E64_03002 [Syntrophorhabdus sp. PtaU1.Bin058]|nr:MAG: hypothetical protein A4E64_03002 [Syntrophorhabdus sp. PtaU1.Bin058]